MTASPGREVDANLLCGAALGSAQARTGAQDPGGQDLSDLVEPLGGGHEVRTKSIGQHTDALVRCEPAFWSASTRRGPFQPIPSGERGDRGGSLRSGGRAGVANVNW